MARVKLTEHKAKTLLFQTLQLPYTGISYKSGDKIPSLNSKKEYVVKVDQGVKKRMKRGLVKLGMTKTSLPKALHELEKEGFTQFIIEEMVPHEACEERYLALERAREGIIVTYSKKGGIDIEEHADAVKKIVMEGVGHPEQGEGSRKALDSSASPQNDSIEQVAQELGIDISFLTGLREFFENYYVSFVEINPLVVRDSRLCGNDNVHILDLAVEVDSTAEFFVRGAWSETDVVGEKHTSPEEQFVDQLNKKSQAAMSFTLLNPNGSIWALLSSGGASLAIADEVYNLGFGKELGNYGEYSGNPNTEETYLYTKAVLDAMLKSKRRRLMLIIGGGVANFTDIRKTFKGVILALVEYKKKLKKKEIKIFVRRGGPHQKEGLAAIEDFARREGMYGLVAGPELPLHEVVSAAVSALQVPTKI